MGYHQYTILNETDENLMRIVSLGAIQVVKSFLITNWLENN